MTDGVVIDANVIHVFYKEYKVETGSVYDIVSWILDNKGVAINEHIATEWKTVCDNQTFLIWYTDQVIAKKIRGVESKELGESIKKKIYNQCGFPVNSLDIHYIKCAHSTEVTKYIMTYNYHFYDPKCHIKSSRKEKTRVREKRQGRLCVFLYKNLDIRVGMPSHCKLDFSIP